VHNFNKYQYEIFERCMTKRGEAVHNTPPDRYVVINGYTWAGFRKLGSLLEPRGLRLYTAIYSTKQTHWL